VGLKSRQSDRSFRLFLLALSHEDRRSRRSRTTICLPHPRQQSFDASADTINPPKSHRCPQAAGGEAGSWVETSLFRDRSRVDVTTALAPRSRPDCNWICRLGLVYNDRGCVRRVRPGGLAVSATSRVRARASANGETLISIMSPAQRGLSPRAVGSVARTAPSVLPISQPPSPVRRLRAPLPRRSTQDFGRCWRCKIAFVRCRCWRAPTSRARFPTSIVTKPSGTISSMRS